MSRCFPFPPPGYEPPSGLRSEHNDLLKKEKRKEMKHKNEKYMETGERKEKCRDHRKDKHNKKHKREKHRERRKNKDRDKDKSRTLEHKTQKSYDLGNRKPEERGQNEASKYIKPTDQLATQIFGEGRANHKCNSTRELLPRSTFHIGATDSKEKERNSLCRTIKNSAQATQDKHGMVQQGDNIAYTNKKRLDRGVDSKTRVKNGKSLQVGSAEKHSSRRHSCNGVDLLQDNSDTQTISQGLHTTSTVLSGEGTGVNGTITPSRNTLQRAEEIGHCPDISVHSTNGRCDRISTRRMMGKENQNANDFRDKMDQQFVRNKDGTVEGKSKTKEFETNYYKGVKGKDRDRDAKKRKTEYKSKEKEMKKNGNVNEEKHEDLGTCCVSGNKLDDLTSLACINEQKFASDDFKKRKDFDAISSPHEHSMRATKLPRMSPTNITHADEEHMALVSSPGYECNKNYLSQPHSDIKYLSQVQSVPSAGDFSECIDQDWLFSEDHVERKTAKSEAAGSRQVWSDAQLIDAADVVALPCVVPL